MQIKELKKTKIQFPDTMAILFIILIIAAIITYIAPAGVYDMVTNVEGKEVIDPNSYHVIPNTPTSFIDFMISIPKGLAQQSSVIFMLLLAMGGIQLLNESKAIDAGIYKLMTTYKNVELPLIIFICIIFGCLGAFAGWNIELVPFIPIVTSIIIAMGYDNMMSLHIAVWPIAAGWSTGVLNVFSTAVMQEIAGLPIFSGWIYRLICFIILMAVGIAFILDYGKRYKQSKESLPLTDTEENSQLVSTTNENTILEFTSRRKIILTISMFGILFLAYCTTAQGWGLQHVGGFWIIMGFSLGLIDGRKINDIIAAFYRGAKGMLPTCLIIGVASAVLIVLEEGNIMSTLTNFMANAMSRTPKPLVGVVVFIMVSLLNGITTSVHGKGAVLIPLFIPLADILGVSRQIIILAFLLGDGITNWFFPTSAIAVSTTGATGVPMNKWMKESWKKFIIFSVIAGVLVFGAYFIAYE